MEAIHEREQVRNSRQDGTVNDVMTLQQRYRLDVGLDKVTGR